MGRPQIYLKDWCLEDGLLKAEFIKKESENPRGLVTRTHQGYLPNLNIYPHFQSGNVDIGRLSNGLSIHVTQTCYEKLKAKFRTFKKNDKDKDKVKKQYSLDIETAYFLSREYDESTTAHCDLHQVKNIHLTWPVAIQKSKNT